MNCQTIQHRILGLANPAELTGSLAEHVSECPACQAWHRVLVHVELAVAALPVPPDSGQARAKLLSQFKNASKKAKPKQSAKPAPRSKEPPKPIPAKTVTPRRSFGDRVANLWPVGAIAGIACVGVVLWSFGSRKAPMETAAHIPDPMLDRVVAAKVQLDVAATPPDRLKVLARLADDLQDQARSLCLVAPGEEMASLSKMYGDIVTEGLLFQAEALDNNEKRQLLSEYTDRLAKTEQQAERLAAEAPVGSDEPLREIARAARNGKIQLAKLREKAL